LGIAASWYEREQRGLGVPVVPVGERFERLEETLRICLQMWSEDNGPFQGRHYRLAETLCVPAPIRRPHPPIMIGGGGEKRTLRLVARYADACNVFGNTPAEVARKLDVLREHCAAFGIDRLLTDVGTLMEVRPLGDGKSIVQWSFFQAPRGAPGRLMHRLVILRQQRRNRLRALRSLKRYAETGTLRPAP
jgi:alkanesulfonate monooxygenase SsuD/methylene tetrahydromethanopterin reductase-like flavin-dependent oxidoreductase (luciferase family)